MITSHLFLLDSIATYINYPHYVWPRYPIPSPRHSFSLLLAKQVSKTHPPFRLIKSLGASFALLVICIFIGVG